MTTHAHQKKAAPSNTLVLLHLPGRSEIAPSLAEKLASALDLFLVERRSAPQEAREDIDRLLMELSAIESAFLVGVPIALGGTERRAPEPDRKLRVLVPVEAGRRNHHASRQLLRSLCDRAEVSVVHVFTEETRPAFWSPGHHEVAWEREFLDRYCGGLLSRLHVRSGVAPDEIVVVARREETQAIALEWNWSPEPERSRTLRALLAMSPVPLLVVPSAAG